MRIDEFCKKLFDAANAQGFEGVEVIGRSGDSFSVNILSGDIESYKDSRSMGVVLRVKHNGRMGSTSTSAIDENYIQQMIDNARTVAETIENDDVVYFAEKSATGYAQPKIYSPELEGVTVAEKIELAKSMEQKALSMDGRVKRVQASTVASGTTEQIFINSNGINVLQKSNSIAGYIAPVVEIDGNMNNCYEGFVEYHMDKIDVDSTVKKAVNEAIELCNTPSIPSGEYRVVIRNDAMRDMLDTFMSVFSADEAQKGFSLLAGKEGTVIASDCVSIKDAPHMDWGHASTGIDGEGAPTSDKLIVENGKFNTLLYDIRTAEKAGVKTTGNSSGGGGICAFNMHLVPGSVSFDELLRRAENGVLITELNGLHAGADPRTGDFSLSARGYVISAGKRAQGISEITLSGNFYSLLKNIDSVGNDLYFGMDDVGSPSVLLREKIVLAGQ